MINKILNIISYIFIFIGILGFSPELYALYYNNKCTVKVILKDSKGKPVSYASVYFLPSGIYGITNDKGVFEVSNIPEGEIIMKVEFFGMQPIKRLFILKDGEKKVFSLKMQETSFRLKNVMVVAEKGQEGKSTSSIISRQAIDHLQTSSLRDILALLPGGIMVNPSLANSQTVTIRGVDKSGALAMNGLGAPVYLDGVPLSNNSNMQTLSPAQIGAVGNPAGGASADDGVDIRGLSTDNIQSVKVIRGIPSVQYGDLTSGAVIVKTIAGVSPFVFRAKVNPNIYQVSLSKGFVLSKKIGELNISSDYAYSNKKITESFRSYQRFNLRTLWTIKPIENLLLNTSANLFYSKDRSRLNPDLINSRKQSKGTSLGLIFNTNGTYAYNGSWLKTIKWVLSASIDNKVSHYESMALNAFNLYSTSRKNGSIYTNNPGMDVYDAITGEKITNSGNETFYGRLLPVKYFYKYDIYGKEVNLFAKLNSKFSHSWGNLTEIILSGLDFKTDGNLGRGTVYNDDAPPYRNLSNVSSGYRQRRFDDIPFISQLGIYAENTFLYKLGSRHFSLSAGLRYNLINLKSVLSPRINFAADLFDGFTLRGGWGIAAKAPTSIYLYPNYAYQDIINFNGIDSRFIGEKRPEDLLVASTNVYSTVNKNLKIATNRKAELGLDVLINKKYRISLTAYDEYMNNGYEIGLLPESFKYFKHDFYTKVHNNPGKIPSIKYDVSNMDFFVAYMPTNNLTVNSKGIEYEVDLGRFDALRTSIYINGAWNRGWSANNNYSYSTRINSNSKIRNIGIYNPYRVKSYEEHLNSAIRITNNIPEIGFVITLTANVLWYSKFWSEFHNEEMFIKYFSHKDGKIHNFNPLWKNSPEFNYLFEPLSINRALVQKYSTYTIFNINISKEIGESFTASFFVNNILNYRSLQKTINGTIIQLGLPTFFGFELKVKIK